MAANLTVFIKINFYEKSYLSDIRYKKICTLFIFLFYYKYYEIFFFIYLKIIFKNEIINFKQNIEIRFSKLSLSVFYASLVLLSSNLLINSTIFFYQEIYFLDAYYCIISSSFYSSYLCFVFFLNRSDLHYMETLLMLINILYRRKLFRIYIMRH